MLVSCYILLFVTIIVFKGEPQCVNAFDHLLRGPLCEYLKNSRAIGGDVAKHVCTKVLCVSACYTQTDGDIYFAIRRDGKFSPKHVFKTIYNIQRTYKQMIKMNTPNTKYVLLTFCTKLLMILFCVFSLI